MLRAGVCLLGALVAFGVVAASPAYALVPNAPAAPAVARNGSGQLLVTYVAPGDNGNPITSYLASCTSSDGGAPGSGLFNTPDGSASPMGIVGCMKAAVED